MSELTNQQIRYAELKATGKLNQREIANMLELHYNTCTNWNKNKAVQEQIQYELDIIRENNQVGIQRLMNSMIKEALGILNKETTTDATKTQLIAQLFTQAGKMSGLEPSKKSEKKVTVTKGIDSIIDAEVMDAIDVEVHE